MAAPRWRRKFLVGQGRCTDGQRVGVDPTWPGMAPARAPADERAAVFMKSPRVRAEGDWMTLAAHE
jgi:hypothetical protein